MDLEPEEIEEEWNNYESDSTGSKVFTKLRQT